MPKHMHGLLIINKSVVTTTVETRFIVSNLGNEIVDDADIGGTRFITSESQDKRKGGFAGKNNPMLAENISRIIRWYKGRCTFEIRKINSNFGWHSSFYDHIIRNSESFERIQNYIEENPARWKEDKFHKR